MIWEFFAWPENSAERRPSIYYERRQGWNGADEASRRKGRQAGCLAALVVGADAAR
jgi:hypothetical protein